MYLYLCQFPSKPDMPSYYYYWVLSGCVRTEVWFAFEMDLLQAKQTTTSVNNNNNNNSIFSEISLAWRDFPLPGPPYLLSEVMQNFQTVLELPAFSKCIVQHIRWEPGGLLSRLY